MNVIKYLSLALATCCLLITGSELSAQSKKKDKNLEKTVELNAEKIERAAQHLEKLAEHLESQSDQLNHHLEKWMEEHGAELEDWAERHASEWEKWAEGFESRMEKWADKQEHHWEKWADEYSERWEHWAEQLEQGDLEPEEMNQLMKRNLEMLSKMPWEKLVKEAMRESAAGLKDAPWESLQEMHEMMGRSVELSLEKLEKSGDKSSDLTAQNRQLRDVVRKLQLGLEQKQMDLEAASKSKISALKIELENSDLSDAKKAQILAALERHYQDAQSAQLALAKEKIAQMNRLRDLERQHVQDEMKTLMAAKKAQDMAQRAEAEAYRAKAESEHARALELKRVAEKRKAIEQAKKSVEKNKAAADLYTELEVQDRKAKVRVSELDALREEIQKLREEIERLKKDKGKD